MSVLEGSSTRKIRSAPGTCVVSDMLAVALVLAVRSRSIGGKVKRERDLGSDRVLRIDRVAALLLLRLDILWDGRRRKASAGGKRALLRHLSVVVSFALESSLCFSRNALQPSFESFVVVSASQSQRKSNVSRC